MYPGKSARSHVQSYHVCRSQGSTFLMTDPPSSRESLNKTRFAKSNINLDVL
ncbi:hypothetical protein GDO86_018228 [Hymenochirus boettgeri]|uniref:Uncharacterized protein n=1 Tax=Hymenochirus boettgeri TaxID=247094 RepID=A0A8T2IG28_9PIPI|nr:hypothetical protein GDO86_018228 [Hymenochirus boettgeri]